MYKLEASNQAQNDIRKLEKSEPLAFKKVVKLLKELTEHPTTGLGHPEQLTGARAGQWSRRITKKHRLVYKIFETEVIVLIIASYGHYDDK